MGPTRRWLIVIFVVGLSLVVGGSVSVAGTPDDAAGVEAQARAALVRDSGNCVALARPLYPPVDVRTLDEIARTLTRPDWIGRVFVGSPEEAATAFDGKIVASGARTAWVMFADSSTGSKSLVELKKVTLPSGRIVWARGTLIDSIPC